jgi:hypothetical protein
MSTVAFSGGKHEAGRIIRSLIASLTGRERLDAAAGVFLAMGVAALTEVHQDFIVKARGGVGSDGVKWPRLSRKTLAYSRRFGPGEAAALKRAAGLGKGHRFAPGDNKGLLTKAQLKQWRFFYSTLLAKYAATMPLSAAKAKAAAQAWVAMKNRGAKTKLEVYGDREHEVLRDTGILANSLSVGTISGYAYNKPAVEGGESQIFELLENGVIVGTNVKYARSHHEGLRGLPKRPIMPTDDNLPAEWSRRILDAGMRALAVAIEQSLQRGSVA